MAGTVLCGWHRIGYECTRMAYRHWGLAVVCGGLLASLSACGDAAGDLADLDASDALDAAIDASAAFDSAVDDARDGGSVAVSDASVDDASMDAHVSDARVQADAADDSGEIAIDANDVTDPDASADAATDSSVTIDPNALSVAIDYQVRCLDCSPTAPDSPERRIHSGESGPDVALECEVSQLGDERFVTFSISYVDPVHAEQSFSLSVRSASLDRAGDPGPRCEVRVREGANEYRSPCIGTAPTSTVACGLQLSLDATDLTGSLRCRNIQHLLTASLERQLVAAATDTEPAMFAFHNCSLLEPSELSFLSATSGSTW